MNVLIIENEIYLAQSIATRLESVGYPCQIVSTIQEATQKPKFDIVLLSGNVGGSLCEMFIRQNAQAIIVMMIAYVSEDTVTKPIRAGAKDYILKPFMIDELIRKIEHHCEHRILRQQLAFYEEYFLFLESEMVLPVTFSHCIPLVVRGDSQKVIDAYVIKFAKERKVTLCFSTLKLCSWKEALQKEQKDVVLYVTHSEQLKKNELKEFLNQIREKNVIVSMVSNDLIDFPSIVDLGGGGSFCEFEGNILPIREYEKKVIQKYENHYSDVELAKRMGISRKNLWEKRKRYGLEKKKETDSH